ncbi:hypothetical protein [Bdellovibrio sp. BCCA]|uniref:hypothetical protein n=1 Tax=Bdellovibrio sp. BCCA TaxID=3136281 RepID=UPI0030F24E46
MAKKEKASVFEKDLKGKVQPVRLSAKELQHIEAQAKKYCNGNISQWIRTAALNFDPNLSTKKIKE